MTLAVAALAVLLQGLAQQAQAVSVANAQFTILSGQLQRPVMKCSMPMIVADPSVDPKIVVEPPKDIDYKIRIIEAPPCR